MQAAEAVLHFFVDLLVVAEGRFPAHAADEADGLHCSRRTRWDE
jgi:hypothetical protein